MNTANELRGAMVLIHPDLTADPAGKSGQIGVITGYEPENDNVYVGFGKGGQGLYGTDAVLMLRNARAILDDLARHKKDNTITDYGGLYKIALIQDNHPDAAGAVQALEIARSNKNTLAFATRSVEQLLGLENMLTQYNER
jgi:hypothetical protein